MDAAPKATSLVVGYLETARPVTGFSASSKQRDKCRDQRVGVAPTRLCAHCGEAYPAVQEFLGYARRFCSRKCAAASAGARKRAQWPDEATMRDLYERQGLTDREIGKRYGRSYNWVLTIRKAYGIAGHPRLRSAPRGSRPPRLPQPHKTSHGYIKIGSEYEHRLVAAEKLGRPLTRTEVVHHIDGDKTNNDPANLEVFASNREHMRACHPNPPRKPRTKADHSVYRHFSLGLKAELFCRNCGDPARDLHHAIPRSMHAGSRTNLLNGLPLCRRCHVRWHQRSIVIYRDVFTAEEWAYVSSVVLLGQDTEAWLDDRYPDRVTNERAA